MRPNESGTGRGVSGGDDTAAAQKGIERAGRGGVNGRVSTTRLGPSLAAAALCAYAALLAPHMGAVAGGSDSSGYLNHAKLLSSGTVHAPRRALPGMPASALPSYACVPLGFKPAPDGRGLVPTYPAGLPLLIAAAAPLAGWAWAGGLVIGLHAILGVVLTYALGRSFGLPARWSILGAAILATSPLYCTYAIQMMSDLPALVWTTASVLCARRASESTRSRAWSLGAGASLALAVLIRPTDVLVLPAIAVALGGAPRRWLAFVLGGAPGAAFFMLHSHAAYGAYLSTGYGDTTTDFGFEYIPATLLHFARWLPALFTPVAALFLALPWLARKAPRSAAILGLWALAFLAFYAPYRFTHETWWYLRFVLPAAPAMLVGGLMVLRRIEEGRMRAAPRNVLFATALALAIGNGRYWNRRLGALSIGQGEKTYARACAWLGEHVPPGAVLAVMQTSGAVFYYTSFPILRYDQIDAPGFERVAAAARAAGSPIYAALFPWEADQALRKRMPGKWTRVGAVPDIAFWRYDG
jgi:hypothetical protein